VIETDIPGRVADVQGCATWLRDLRDRTVEAADLQASARRVAGREWDGLAADSYGDFTKRTMVLTDTHAERIGRAADAVDDYAAHLQRVQERMRQIRAEARAGGLVVSGTVIVAPDPAVRPGPLPVDVTPRQVDAYDAAVAAYADQEAKVLLYNRLAGEVESECSRHEEWIDAHLGPAAADAEKGEEPGALVQFLQDSSGPFLIGSGLMFTERSLEDRAKNLEKLAARNQKKAADLKRWRRSGNPARRAEARAPEAKERIKGWNRAAEEALEHGKWMRLGGKALGPLGIAVDGYYGYQDIQDGKSPTGVVLSTVGGSLAAAGVVAGAGALAAAGVVTVPVWGTALAAGAAAVGVGWAVSAGWDHLPDGFTDTVDNAVTGAWDATSDAVSGGWDATTDVVSDGWDEVTGWF
jgi:hypothetical protein